MYLTNPIAETYISNHSSINDEALFNLHQQTLQNHPQQHMLSSWVQGQFLTFISQLAKPTNILEIGTFTGNVFSQRAATQWRTTYD
jgi:caffeoyl-CoA O-methyltransferase